MWNVFLFMKYLIGFIVLVIIVLTIRNNDRFVKENIVKERIEAQRDSLYLMYMEDLLDGIQSNALGIDSLMMSEKYMDSIHLEYHKQILQKMNSLIYINQQILKQTQIKRCSISSIIHTVE